jgi:hypothetical protein
MTLNLCWTPLYTNKNKKKNKKKYQVNKWRIFKFRIKQTTNLKPDNISRKESSFWFLKRVEIIQNGTCRWQS